MVFYGLNGSSVAFNGGIARARAFEPYTVNLSLLSSSGIESSMSASAFDRGGNYLYSARVTPTNSASMTIPASGTVQLLRRRANFKRMPYVDVVGMSMVDSAAFYIPSSTSDPLFSACYQSALFSASGDVVSGSIVGSNTAEKNSYILTGYSLWENPEYGSFDSSYMLLDTPNSSYLSQYLIATSYKNRSGYKNRADLSTGGSTKAAWSAVKINIGFSSLGTGSYDEGGWLRGEWYDGTLSHFATATIYPRSSGIQYSTASASPNQQAISHIKQFVIVKDRTASTTWPVDWTFSGVAL